MIACLSPNGGVEYAGDALQTLKVGTVEGIHTFRREGQAWRRDGVVRPDLHVGALLYEPRSKLMFAGAHGGGGLWRSANEGMSWERIGRTVHPHIYAVQAQPRGETVRLWVGTEPAALFFSDDLGESWTERASLKSVPEHENWTFPPPPHIGHVKQTTWHDSAPDTIYVLVEQGGVFKSTDAGLTWTEIKSYLFGDQKFYRDMHRLCIRKSNPDHLFLATGDGLCRSLDGGASWTYLMTKDGRIGYPDAMFIDPLDQNKIVIGGPKAAPQNWRETQRAEATVMVSRDGGDHWAESNDGMNAPLRGNVEAMARYQGREAVTYIAGTATGELFVSDDGCAHWQQLASDLPPISKAGHFRWFMSEAERAAVEERMRGWKKFAS